MIEIIGQSVSPGISIAKAYILEKPVLNMTSDVKSYEEERQDVINALQEAGRQIDKIKGNVDDNQALIFEIQSLLLKDEEFFKAIDEFLRHGENSLHAVINASEVMVQKLDATKDRYFQDRSDDIRDIAYRTCCCICGQEIPNLSAVDEEVIVVAKNITPSDTALFNQKYVKGIITEQGSRTSHSAILARSMGIPCIIDTRSILSIIRTNDHVILDGEDGKIIINPSEAVEKEYESLMAKLKEQIESFKLEDNGSVKTADGRSIELAGNIMSFEGVDKVIEYGGQSIGLFRTEFIYMSRQHLYKDEDAQFNIYKNILEKMEGKRVIIRTLDIGGDKSMPFATSKAVDTSFLGLRGIRFSFENDEIFRVQIRALLRSSKYGKLGIMFPMIATVNEYRRAKQIVEEEKANLLEKGIEIGEDLEIGMMIEVPSAAILSDVLAKEVDFFSIGTNDLIQYTLAVDRMNEEVSYLYQPLNPVILRLIKQCVTAAHKNDKWVSVCGEIAADETIVPLLVGLGVDELSMSANDLLKVRHIIHNLSYTEATKIADEACEMSTQEDVQKLIGLYSV